MKKHYYADSTSAPQGPFTMDELRELAANGTINATTMVCADGDPAWVSWAELAVGQPQASRAPQTTVVVQVGSGPASQVTTVVQWGSVGRAVLMVIWQFFALPVQLLRKALLDLTDWGNKGTLPSSKSDLPVMTFLLVALRPVLHVLLTVYAVLNAMDSLSQGDRLWCAIWVIVAYIGQTVLGLFFDAFAAFVHMANSLKKIENK